jgi:lipoprotein-releasing system permease protein
MNFRIQIAVRYLLSKREAGFITVISAISILGITIGVAALIVVLSVFNGFNTLVTDILVGFDPHVRIQISKSTTKDEIEKVDHYLTQKNIPGVAKFVSGKVMMISKKMTKVVYLRGIDAINLNKVSGVGEKLVFGNSNLIGGYQKIILGLSLADRLDVETRDSVYVLSSSGAQNVLMNNQIPQLQSFEVEGVYESNNKDYDGLYCFTSL